MELSKNILDGIHIAGSSSVIEDAKFNMLLTEVLEISTCRKNTKESDSSFASSSEKTAYSCLLSLVLEAAKYDVDASTLSSLLEECRWESSRIASFTSKFQGVKEEIQTKLSLIGKQFDQIIDVKWRQDFIIKSSNCEKICEPSYVVSLKTWNQLLNSEKDVVFSCSMEQLQDLVLKLKDATKCIERNAVA